MMQMAQVIGSVVATQKEESLHGKKLMIVQPINSQQEAIRYQEVAIDTVSAGIGEYVLLTRGASARKLTGQGNSVVDCAIVGIIDSFER